ncbi:MAG: HTH-type transcriptional regulator McbR [Syntrophaceae bacterium PtaU1.Bin231]|nr:MAG: HTH-type transcriptional regulator McbR [Syntrophaceae bacterium PtaU1.Bin231]
MKVAIQFEIYDKIKEMLYNHQLVAGQKVIYTDLAKALKTSVSPVIIALKRLEASNLVTYIPNKGYFIADITEKQGRELYQARQALEMFILPDIIKNISAEKIGAIENKFKRLQVSDPRDLFLHDAQFHLSLIEFGENDFIYNLLSGIFEQLCLKYRPQYLSEQRAKLALKEHHDIIVALKKRDLKEAKKAVTRHIEFGLRNIVDRLSMSQYGGICSISTQARRTGTVSRSASGR